MKRFIILFFLITISCSTSKNVDKSIIKICLDDYKKKSLDYIQDFSIYETYSIFENSLIKKGLLEKNNKQSYIKLLESIKLNNNEMVVLRNQLADEIKNFDLLANPAIFNSPFNCVRFYLINGDLDKNKSSKYLKDFDGLFIADTQLNIKSIQNIPEDLFKEFDFRLPVLATIYFKLFNLSENGKVKF